MWSTPAAQQRLDQLHRAGDVVQPVPRRLLHRLADALVCGEVHDLGDPVVGAGAGDASAVGDVADDQRHAGDRLPMAELERVEHDDVGPVGLEAAHGVRADVAGTAGDQNAHLASRAAHCTARLEARSAPPDWRA